MIFSVCGFGAFANLTYGPALIGRKAVGRALGLNDAMTCSRAAAMQDPV